MPAKSSRLKSRRARAVILTALLAYGPILAAYGACITGLGLWTISGVELFLAVPLLGLSGVVCAACCLPFRKHREGAMTGLIVSAAIVFLFVPAVLLGGQLRTFGFYLAAKRAAPLVAAIRRYESDRGMPPAALVDLVPDYLPALPGGLPPLRLVTGERASRHCRGNSWVLWSPVSSGSLNFDEFLYAPLENYDDCGRFERIGSWAYYHE